MTNELGTMQLPVKLSDAEMAEIGKFISDKAIEIERIQSESKRVAGLRTEILELSHKLNSGVDFRAVEIDVQLDIPHVGRKTIFRKDTGELVIEEAMNENERQTELPLGAPSNILPMNPTTNEGKKCDDEEQ